jgi:hypothetical protein
MLLLKLCADGLRRRFVVVAVTDENVVSHTEQAQIPGDL